ncbi:hypothetical protein DIPPA_23578 [Diplonema papillatum]|nr:hypothetical protein DIPPA_23578 [Diplonema papillatum]
MESWEEFDDPSNDLARWVKDRTGRGDKGILSLQSLGPGVMDRGAKRGYAGDAARLKPIAKGGAFDWNGNTGGRIPKYDSARDRHCKSLVASAPYRLTQKRQTYAAEVAKAQRRFQPLDADGHYGGGGHPSYYDSSGPDQSHPRAARHSHPRAKRHTLPSPYKRAANRGNPYAAPPARIPPHVFPPKPPLPNIPHHHQHPHDADPNTGSEADTEASPKARRPRGNPPEHRSPPRGGSHNHNGGPSGRRSGAKKFAAAYASPPPSEYQAAFPRKRGSAPAAGAAGGGPGQRQQPQQLPQQQQQQQQQQHRASAGHRQAPSDAAQTLAAGGDLGEGGVKASVPDLLRMLESVDDRNAQLEEQLAAATERLAVEMQKKTRSSKKAASTDATAADLKEQLLAAAKENQKLKERVRAQDNRAERFSAAEQDKRRLSSLLQDKDTLCRDLRDVLEKTEARLLQYESVGAIQKTAKLAGVDKEHLKSRLQRESRTRNGLEKKLALAKAEADEFRAELAKASEAAEKLKAGDAPAKAPVAVCPSCSRGPAGKREAEADTAAAEGLKRELADARAKADELKASLERQFKALSACQRREAVALKRCEELEQSLLAASTDAVKKATTTESEAAKLRRDVTELRITHARTEADAQQAKAARTDLEATVTTLRAEASRLSSELAGVTRSRDTLAAGADQKQGTVEAAFRKKQLSWERDRTELVAQNTKMRIREQELAAEAGMHESAAASLRSQLRALKEAAEHQAAPGGREGEAAGLKEQVKALERKHDALRKAHEKLLADRGLSQKDSVIETLTKQLRDAERLAGVLRETNAALIERTGE